MQKESKPIESELFELMFQASPVATLLADEAGQILLVNPAAEKLLGYRKNHILHKPLADLIPWAHNHAHACSSSPIATEPSEPRPAGKFSSSLIFEERLPLGVDGEPVTAAVSLYRVDSQGSTYALVNISDPYYTQAGQFPDPKLDAIAGMIRGLAHECRNALQRARGCLDLLELDLATQPQLSELADRIRVSLEDLERNYNEVRDYAAPIVLERQDCDLEDLLRSVHGVLEAESANGIGDLITDITQECRVNRMDRMRMEVVFRNLMLNAWQAGPEDADLVARVRRADYLRRSWQRIEIQDFGNGIAEAVRGRVFDPFFTTKQHGNGLGLAICRRIVEAHGGYITVAASKTDGTGTTIRVDLPFSASLSST